ncbi:PIG-L family deacetylase [Dactylosporangium sp. CA-233914]|uniref:PIG-L family deacetylase n=1 Tax=Dactylosporangium sp. CA-233914 TaxID=3239934 RepID=UPI003D917B08
MSRARRGADAEMSGASHRTFHDFSPDGRKITLVAFHAHPDDETLLTGGTLARAAAEGHRVVLVTATLGEAGLANPETPTPSETRPTNSESATPRQTDLAQTAALTPGQTGPTNAEATTPRQTDLTQTAALTLGEAGLTNGEADLTNTESATPGETRLANGEAATPKQTNLTQTAAPTPGKAGLTNGETATPREAGSANTDAPAHGDGDGDGDGETAATVSKVDASVESGTADVNVESGAANPSVESGAANPSVGSGAVDVGADNRLGARRRRELLAAAAVLGCARVETLGYADSGLDAGAVSARQRFADVPVQEAAGRLAAILREERADLVTGYDANGGYGHPDHLQVHRVARAAAALTGTPLLEATVDRSVLRPVLAVLGLAGRLVPGLPLGDASRVFSARAEITHVVDVRGYQMQKRAAMKAHASQAEGGTGIRTLALLARLPGPLFRAVCGREWFHQPPQR